MIELCPVPAALAERYRAEGAWDDRTLGQLLSDALLEDPSRRFRIWSPTHPYLGTVGDVYEEALRVAGGLRSLGLGPGDVVAFQLPNWVEAAVTFYACAMLGVTLVPIVHFYGPKEVGFILRQSRARALIIVSRFGRRDYLAELATIRDGLPDLEHEIVVGDPCDESETTFWTGLVPFDELRRAEPIDGPVPVDPDGAALIAYTSGTTADPKGVVHTHRTIGCEVRQLSGHQAVRDRPNLVGAPVGHAIGMLGGLLCPLVGGKPLFLIDGWDPPTVLDAMVEEQISAGSGSTYFFTSLLDCPGFGPEHVELMRYVGLGGSPIPDAVAERADELGISLVRSYGCTEHPSVTGSQHSAPREKRIHTDGCPLEWVEVRTVDEEDRDVGVGRPGEILTRGPDRFAGYTDPALTAAAIDGEGWFRTGDVGCDRRRRLPDHHRPGEGHHHPRWRERERRRGRAVAGPPGGRGGGGRGGRTRRATGRARMCLLPHAAGERGAGPRGGAGAPGRGRAGPAEVARGAAGRRRAAPDGVGQGAEVRPAATTAQRR